MNPKHYNKETFLDLEWDDQKNLNNLVKHGLRFEDAIHVFNNHTVTFEDDRQDYGETRYITLGVRTNSYLGAYDKR